MGSSCVGMWFCLWSLFLLLGAAYWFVCVCVRCCDGMSGGCCFVLFHAALWMRCGVVMSCVGGGCSWGC